MRTESYKEKRGIQKKVTIDMKSPTGSQKYKAEEKR